MSIVIKIYGKVIHVKSLIYVKYAPCKRNLIDNNVYTNVAE